MTCWPIISDIIIQFTPNPTSEMVNYRRPARKSIRGRKATLPKRTFTAPRRKTTAVVDTRKGTLPQTFLVHRGIGLPDKLRTKIMYAESLTLGPFTPATLSKAFNLSTPYDPDPAIGGGQPTYWDQLSTIYQAYNVVGAKMTARFATPDNTGVTNNGPYMIGITGSRASTLSTTDAPTLSTQPQTGHDLIVEGLTKTLSTMYYPSMLNADGTNQGRTSGVTPTPTAYYGIVWASPQVAATGAMTIVVTIEYTVDFYDLLPVIDV